MIPRVCQGRHGPGGQSPLWSAPRGPCAGGCRAGLQGPGWACRVPVPVSARVGCGEQCVMCAHACVICGSASDVTDSGKPGAGVRHLGRGRGASWQTGRDPGGPRGTAWLLLTCPARQGLPLFLPLDSFARKRRGAGCQGDQGPRGDIGVAGPAAGSGQSRRAPGMHGGLAGGGGSGSGPRAPWKPGSLPGRAGGGS